MPKVVLNEKLYNLENSNENEFKFLVKGDLASNKDANRTISSKNEKLEKTVSDLTKKKEENETEIAKFKEEVKKLTGENVSISAESKRSSDEATRALESLKLKEEEISTLKSLVDKDETELKVKSCIRYSFDLCRNW